MSNYPGGERSVALCDGTPGLFPELAFLNWSRMRSSTRILRSAGRVRMVEIFEDRIEIVGAEIGGATRRPGPVSPARCPQCQDKHPLTEHGFYTRTLIDTAFQRPNPRATLSLLGLPPHRVAAVEQDPPKRHRRPTSAASSGSAVSAPKPKRCASPWPG